MGFDLQRLQEIDPPTGFCQYCQAIYLSSDYKELEGTTKKYLEKIRKGFKAEAGKSMSQAFSKAIKDKDRDKTVDLLDLLHEVVDSSVDDAYGCPVCGKDFTINPYYLIEENNIGTGFTVLSNEEQYENVMDYFTLDGVGFIHLFEDQYSLSHLMKMGWFAKRFNETKDINYLIQAISEAEYFIHFATYSFGLFFHGIFTTVSQDIPVKGIIGKDLKDWKRDVIEEGPDINMRYKHEHGREIYYDRADKFNKVHQKVLIIDGLVAFSGSMNLTANGVKNLKQGKESFEAKSIIEKVKEQDHQLFASNFHKLEKDYRLAQRKDRRN